MQLLAAWKDALNLLLPKKFALFVGAIALNALRTYRVWLSKGWWLLALFCQAYMLYRVQSVQSIPISFLEWSIGTGTSLLGFPLLVTPLERMMEWDVATSMAVVVHLLAVFTLYVSARPSVERKNYVYFFHYYWHFLLFCSWCVVGGMLERIVFKLPYFILPFFSYPLVWYGKCVVLFLLALRIVMWMYLLAIAVFTTCFLLDSSGSIKDLGYSIMRAVRMTWLSLPIVIVTCIALLCLLVSFSLVCGMLFRLFPKISSIAPLVLSFGYTLVLPIAISCWATLYIKRLYDNSALYLE